MSQVDKKTKFIRDWYKKECESLSFGNSLKLARAWIDICLIDEEYEIVSAIKEERQKIIKNHIKNKRKNRRFSQWLIIFIYLAKRKFFVWFRKILSK